MNFKSMTLKAAALATLSVASAASVATPSQAATIGGGLFSLQGKSRIVSKVGNFTNPSKVTVSFSDFTINAKEEAFSKLKGNPVLANLQLIKGAAVPTTSSFIYRTSSTVTDFIKGIYLDKNNNNSQDPGEAISFNLDPSAFTGHFKNATDYSFGGDISVTAKNGDEVLGFGTLGAVRLNGKNLANVAVVTIPTPALLPGLIGMGIAAIRKRKSEESEVEVAETAKA